jgi:hypothetical protein
MKKNNMEKKGKGIMTIELVPLCTMRLQSKPAVEVGVGPAGTRLIVDCTSVEVKGDRRARSPVRPGSWKTLCQTDRVSRTGAGPCPSV